MRRLIAAILLAVVCASASGAPASPDAITGFWRTADGGAVVHITNEHDDFVARIVWLKQARYPADDAQGMGGRRILDRHNPDAAKRDRPVIGLRMIKDLNYHVSDNDRARWKDGRVYDPDRGKWFDCDLWLADRDHLKLHGYIGIRMLGRTTTWTRVADPRTTADLGGERNRS